MILNIKSRKWFSECQTGPEILETSLVKALALPAFFSDHIVLT